MNPPTVNPELKALLRRVKLGRCLDTLPERLALARTAEMGHAEFLELVIADEVARRETTSADRRAHAAGLDPTMTLDRWDDTAKITYDRPVWNELCSLRFVESGHNAVIIGPVGVGKTFLANALGHAAIRRRFTVHFERCDRLLKRLRASRLDNSHDNEDDLDVGELLACLLHVVFVGSEPVFEGDSEHADIVGHQAPRRHAHIDSLTALEPRFQLRQA